MKETFDAKTAGLPGTTPIVVVVGEDRFETVTVEVVDGEIVITGTPA